MTRRTLPVALVMMLTGATPARAADVRLSYELNVGGMTAATAELRFTPDGQGDSGYHLMSDLRTVGLAAIVLPFTSRAESRGQQVGTQSLPQQYRSDNVWRDIPRLVQLTYQPGSPPARVTVPTPAEEGRAPVSDDEASTSLDPLAATFALLHDQAAHPASSQQVFDGRRLYRLGLKDCTARRIDLPVYKGDGWGCQITYRRLGGRADEVMFQLQGDEQQASLLLAPVGTFGSPVAVPLRVEVDTLNFGGLVVLLTSGAS
ncbi:DUF3108 domain-containing protein [Insolitispirillum peregrinum]|uniref:DUF3108 domain-containing protein n=1 Tax=Insolitispirillum peregrinum TaxID=80876 RepID=UPI003610169D